MSSPDPAAPTPLAHVLVADDDDMCRGIVTRILRNMGCQVDAVSNGLQAAEAAQRVRYDLIIMDGQMPEMDGPAAAQTIRRIPGRNGQARIVGITGATREITEDLCLEAGMDDYLAKPLGKTDYEKLVRQWVSSRGETARPRSVSTP